MSPGSKTGVLLMNLGTPDSPSTPDVREYLREFLSDPRVLTMAAPLRWMLLNLVILRTRPKKSAAAYAKIWTDRGSPLLFHTADLAELVADRLGSDYVTRFAMRYGSPSIDSALAELEAAGVDRIISLPLYPQFADAVTTSTEERVDELVRARFGKIRVDSIGPFYDDPGFASAWAAVAKPELDAFHPDHVLFSYHGLPENQIKAADPGGKQCLVSPDCCEAPADPSRCYRAQCFATTVLLRRAMDLESTACSNAFQSRLGATPWIKPHTDVVLPELAQQGIKRLAVLCPAFVADCLETVEEIGIRARDQWREVGGEELLLVPCPNADPSFADAVAGLVRRVSD